MLFIVRKSITSNMQFYKRSGPKKFQYMEKTIVLLLY